MNHWWSVVITIVSLIVWMAHCTIVCLLGVGSRPLWHHSCCPWRPNLTAYSPAFKPGDKAVLSSPLSLTQTALLVNDLRLKITKQTKREIGNSLSLLFLRWTDTWKLVYARNEPRLISGKNYRITLKEDWWHSDSHFALPSIIHLPGCEPDAVGWTVLTNVPSLGISSLTALWLECRRPN